MTHPHLAKHHPQYPKGFPARLDDELLGHWQTPGGIIVVENHPHGYELHFFPCYRFDTCDFCAPDRGPSNPHVPDDGHHFRLCENRGPVVTVAGGQEGQRAVLEYLAMHDSDVHASQLAHVKDEESTAETEMRERERVEHEAQMAEQDSIRPSPEERIAAIEAELAALKQTRENR